MLLARGLRRGEVLGLSWEAVDLDAATLTVARSMVTLPGGVLELGTPKTAGSRRTVRLSPRLVAVLRAHRATQAADRLAAGPLWDGMFTDDAGDVVSLVFTDEAGRPMPGHRVNSALNRIAETAIGRKVNPHLLRHSAASYLYSTGMDEATIAGVLGHASPAVTRAVYAHALEDRVREGGDALDAAFGMG